MWMMPLHLDVNQKSDYDMMMMMYKYCLSKRNSNPIIMSHFKVIFFKTRLLELSFVE